MSLLMTDPNFRLKVIEETINALSKWTIHINFNTAHDEYKGPTFYADEWGMGTLNLNPSAIRNYTLNKVGMSFSCKLQNAHFTVFIPINAIAGLYAKEDTTKIMGFPFEGYNPDGKPSDPPTPPEVKPVRKRFKPKIVKQDGSIAA